MCRETCVPTPSIDTRRSFNLDILAEHGGIGNIATLTLSLSLVGVTATLLLYLLCRSTCGGGLMLMLSYVVQQ